VFPSTEATILEAVSRWKINELTGCLGLLVFVLDLVLFFSAESGRSTWELEGRWVIEVFNYVF
jgi:hypothetical protein